VAKVDIQTEEESGRGWEYHAKVERDQGQTTEHTVKLAWVDHEHWSGGRVAPSKVVESLLEFLLEREGKHLIPASFDAATVRRWYPEVDKELPGRF
jgi:hypothetical protein